MSERHFSVERTVVANAHPGKRWLEKVLQMSDEQIHAIYVSIMQKKEKERNDHSKERAG